MSLFNQLYPQQKQPTVASLSYVVPGKTPTALFYSHEIISWILWKTFFREYHMYVFFKIILTLINSGCCLKKETTSWHNSKNCFKGEDIKGHFLFMRFSISVCLSLSLPLSLRTDRGWLIQSFRWCRTSPSFQRLAMLGDGDCGFWFLIYWVGCGFKDCCCFYHYISDVPCSWFLQVREEQWETIGSSFKGSFFLTLNVEKWSSLTSF